MDEHFKGRSLHDLLDNGDAVYPHQAVKVTIDLLAHLEALHKQKKANGSIFPDRVIFDTGGHAKLLTPDSHRELEALPLPDLCFVSPEQLEGMPVTMQSDIYAMGIVLFALLSGRLPFNGRTRSALIEQILQTNLEPLPAPFSSEGQLSEIIRKCTMRDGELRFRSVNELALELGKLIGLSPVKKSTPANTKPLISEPKPTISPVKVAPPEAKPITASMPAVVRKAKPQKSAGFLSALQEHWKIIVPGMLLLLLAGVIFILLSSRKPRISNFKGFDSRRITSDREIEQDPSFSPAGDSIVYVSNTGGNWEMYMKRLNQKGSIQLSESPGSEETPRWSPKGDLILYTYRQQGMPPTIFAVPPNGGIPQKLATDAVEGQWSPDGKQICYVSPATNEVHNLHVLDLHTGASDVILKGEKGLAHPCFSADGTEIVYDVDLGQNHGLALVKIGSKKKKILTEDSWDEAPSWDWKTGYIYFSSRRQGSSRIWRRNSDGDLEQISTGGGGGDYNPSTSYDGRRVVFHRLKTVNDIYSLNPENGTSQIESPAPGDSLYPRSVAGSGSLAYLSLEAKGLALRWSAKDASPPITIIDSIPKQPFISVAPDGASLFIEYPAEMKKGLWQIILKEKALVKLGESAVLPYEFSPDRKFLFLARNKDQQISYVVKNLKTQKEEELFVLPADYRILRAFWAEQGKSLIFLTKDQTLSLWSLKNKSATAVFDDKCHDFALKPKSTLIAALTGDDVRNAELILFDFRNGKRRVLTRFAPESYASSLDWARDGSVLYYDRFKPGADLYLAEGK